MRACCGQGLIFFLCAAEIGAKRLFRIEGELALACRSYVDAVIAAQARGLTVNVEAGLGEITILIDKTIPDIGKFSARLFSGSAIDFIERQHILRHAFRAKGWLPYPHQRKMLVVDHLDEGGDALLIFFIPFRRSGWQTYAFLGDCLSVVRTDHHDDSSRFLLVQYLSDVVGPVEMIVAHKAGGAIYPGYNLKIGVQRESNIKAFGQTVADEITDNKNLFGIWLFLDELDCRGRSRWRRRS